MYFKKYYRKKHILKTYMFELYKAVYNSLECELLEKALHYCFLPKDWSELWSPINSSGVGCS